MHDADGVPSRRCVKNSTLLCSRVEFPRKTILFFSLSTWQGALYPSISLRLFISKPSSMHLVAKVCLRAWKFRSDTPHSSITDLN